MRTETKSAPGSAPIEYERKDIKKILQKLPYYSEAALDVFMKYFEKGIPFEHLISKYKAGIKVVELLKDNPDSDVTLIIYKHE